MSKKDVELTKRNYIDRMLDIYQYLELNTLHSPPSVRNFLRENYNDSISRKTIRKLLKKIIEAQDKGLEFRRKNKIRKLIIHETSNKRVLYELKEIND